MSRLLVEDEWFDAISSRELLEREFERIVLSRSQRLFPGFRATRYSRTVTWGSEVARPDLVLIHEACSSWWIVEVEMSRHSLEGHVIPQVRTFLNGEYGTDVAKHLAKALPEFDVQSLSDLLKGEPPGVLVVADKMDGDWQRLLRVVGAQFGACEIFRSDLGRLIYHYAGFTPPASQERVTSCRWEADIAFLMRIDSPAPLLREGRDKLTMWVGDRLYEWRVLENMNRVWLQPRDQVPLPDRGEFEVVLRDGRLVMRIAEEKPYVS